MNEILQHFKNIGTIYICPQEHRERMFAAELGDGMVLVWFDDGSQRSPKILHNVKKIHVTEFHLVIETDNGILKTWGRPRLDADDKSFASNFQFSRLRRIENDGYVYLPFRLYPN